MPLAFLSNNIAEIRQTAKKLTVEIRYLQEKQKVAIFISSETTISRGFAFSFFLFFSINESQIIYKEKYLYYI